MSFEDQLEKVLCYVYMGQYTGNYGLLESDLQTYEKGLQCSGSASTLTEMGLIAQDFLSRLTFGGYEKPVFYKTTSEGEKRAKEALRRVIANAVDITIRLKTIPR